MMKQNEDMQPTMPSNLSEQLTAIRVAAQLMCRQSEGRQTYPIAKSIVMLTDQALASLKQSKAKHD